MSRYTLHVNDDYAVYVGWDDPLQEFFIQILSRTSDHEVAIIEVGDIDELKEKIITLGMPFGPLQEQRLRRDRDASTEPSPLQRLARRMSEEMENADEQASHSDHKRI